MPIQVLLNIVKGFQGSKKRKRSHLASCQLSLPEVGCYQDMSAALCKLYLNDHFDK
jgi:hypothetical protein